MMRIHSYTQQLTHTGFVTAVKFAGFVNSILFGVSYYFTSDHVFP